MAEEEYTFPSYDEEIMKIVEKFGGEKWRPTKMKMSPLCGILRVKGWSGVLSICIKPPSWKK